MHPHSKHIGYHRRTAKNRFCKKKQWILFVPAVFVSDRMSGFRAQIFPGSEGNKSFFPAMLGFSLTQVSNSLSTAC